jgi:beta-lactamase superfamily II metal-dependent hydrolase
MRIMKNHPPKIYNTLLVIVLILSSCISYSSSLKVTFFDVGQGNCSLVTCEPNPPLLVDCGSSSNAYRGAYFKENQVTKIAEALKSSSSSSFFLVVSHPDEDHYSWLPDVLIKANKNGLSIQNAWLGGTEIQYGKKLTNELKKYLGSMYASKVFFPTSSGATTSELRILTSGDLSYTILPALSCGADKTKEANSASLVVKVLYFNKVILLPGDATRKTFDHIGALLPNKVLIMLASHHGADPSSDTKAEACNDDALVNATEPQVLVFSSGRRADYYHPRSNAVSSYAKVQKTFFNWHPLFCGISSSNKFEDAPVVRLADNYGVILTNRPIFSTLTNGTIICTVNNSDSQVKIDLENRLVYDSAINAALIFPLFEKATAFSHSEISELLLDSLGIDDTEASVADLLAIFFKTVTAKCKNLKALNLNDNNLSQSATFDRLIALLNALDVSSCKVEGGGIVLTKDLRAKITQAWNQRGLRLEPEAPSDPKSL